MTNILVTAMLLTGGSAVLTSLTGVHTAAACFLLPIGVVLYTLFGGIKATFITDYMHTVVIIVVIFIFAFSAYATNAELGSLAKCMMHWLQPLSFIQWKATLKVVTLP